MFNYTAIIILSAINIVLLLILIFKKDKQDELIESIDKNLKDEFLRNREEATNNSKLIREELLNSIKSFNDSLLTKLNDFSNFQNNQFQNFNSSLQKLIDSNIEKLLKMHNMIGEKLTEFITILNKISKENRDELQNSFNSFEKKTNQSIENLIEQQVKNFKEFNISLKDLSEKLENNLEKMRLTVENKLSAIQQDNNQKLEKMRETVEEKLQSTLHKRIGESFKLVTAQLEAVQKGLGEMRNLANGVGDLKKVLTNVKSRGTWGEVQLHAILEEILTPEQYSQNVLTDPSSIERVEFAVKLPGKGKEDSVVWLPIDSKFPQEDYIRLIDSIEMGDIDSIQKCKKDLERAVIKSAQDISEKYINPPYTTDFAIMFLPTEGLYAEVIRIPGLMERIQQNYRIVIAGPTTMSAILNSLRIGFRTLAIERRSAEVWKILSAVKTEFRKFNEVLERVKKQLNTASNTIEQTGIRTRAMERKLREVEELPEVEAKEILEIDKF